MVEITIMIEGGVLEHENIDVATRDNSESLRQSFHRIFTELLGSEVKIIVQPLAGNKNAARIFAKSFDSNAFLYTDLDDIKAHIDNWFNKLEIDEKPIIFGESKKEKIFFMIQEMEAWILKQPEIIELWGKNNNYKRTNPDEIISNHSLISRKDIESIEKPSTALSTIIKHFFSRNVNGQFKKVRYGKLKTAPNLLDCLDVEKLKNSDSEIDRFYQYVKGNLIRERIVSDNRH
ncbi:hypothetical protein AGMMS49965_07230 [Bacteroidia bacterium]|nr:hypothetical protein AGMMS49965_07230 [Bacteroidia bacterium]